jgi:hypothetical protein
MLLRSFREFRSADEAQLAISDRDHRCRPRRSIDEGKFSGDRAGARMLRIRKRDTSTFIAARR